MALSHNKQLYDTATRLAVYVEGIKAYQTTQFNKLLAESSELLSKTLWRIKYETLDGLSKAQLNKLLLELRKSQSKIYSAYTTELIKMLRDFMHVDLTVNRKVWVDSALSFEDWYTSGEEIPDDNDAIEYIKDNGNSSQSWLGLAAITGAATANGSKQLWSVVTNKPIAANGMTIEPFIRHFTLQAQANVENTFRKAWVNNYTVKQLNQELLGETVQGTGSLMARIRNQSRAIIHTVISEVHATVTGGVSSSLFGRYQWHSMMDSRTTEICRSRHLKIYEYGKGPIPPAHINCRSHIVPLGNGEAYQVDESLFEWLTRQPQIVKKNMSLDKPVTLKRLEESVNILLWR